MKVCANASAIDGEGECLPGPIERLETEFASLGRKVERLERQVRRLERQLGDDGIF